MANEINWQCEACGTVYAEYVNGCPICWDRGLRVGVYNDVTDHWCDHCQSEVGRKP